MRIKFGEVVLVLQLIAASPATSAFAPPRQSASSPVPSPTAVFGRAIKRGSLAKNVSPGGVAKTKARQKSSGKKGSNTPSKSKKSAPAATSEGGDISPDLAEWAAALDGETEGVQTIAPPAASSAAAAARRTKGKKKKENKSGVRRVRQAERQAATAARNSAVMSIVDDLEDIFEEEKRDIGDILSKIRSLIDLGEEDGIRAGTGIKRLASSSTNRDYRMAWVGSDAAISHVGTGLHKVPLARLQEVFFTLGGGRVEVLEVIRILGPFPNVRNTLRGAANVEKGGAGSRNECTRFSIAYNSMIDGTGKEILAGKEDNVKNVDLEVWYADENAIVCTVPPLDEEETIEDPLGANGSNVLLFFGEDELNDKLEALRAL